MLPRNATADLLRRFAILEDLRQKNLTALAAASELHTCDFGSSLFATEVMRTRTHFLLSGSLRLEIGNDIAHTVDSGSERARFPISYLKHQQCVVRVASRQAEIISLDTALYNQLTVWEQTGHFQLARLREGGDDAPAPREKSVAK